MVIEQKPETLTLRDLISRFLSRRNLSPRTVDYYSNILSDLQWYARQNDWPEQVENITRGHIRDFLDYVATERHRWPEGRRPSYEEASPATVHHYGKVVKTFLHWAEDEEYLDENPSSRLKLGAPHYKEVEPYTDEEVQAFLRVCEQDAKTGYRYLGIRNKAIISLFVATGWRLEELSGISLPDFDARLQQVQVTGKGAKMRVVPLNGRARKALKRYLTSARQPGGDELWKTDDGQPLSRCSIKIMVERLKKRAGVSSGGGAHRFRHYFATRYLEAGGDINSLRLLLGHATLNMVLHYSQYVDVQKALVQHEQFSPLDGLYKGSSSMRDGWGWRG